MADAGFILWFTGLSGAGKSTLTAIVAAELRRRGVHVEPLDGDEIRKNLSKGLGFSKEDRDANIRRLGFVAKLIARSGGCAITAAISPYREVRDEVRRGAPRFCEVFCDCPVQVLAERDPKGLYEKALRGEIKNFTGVDDPYEPPLAPELHLYTNREAPEASAQRVLARLEELGFVPRSGGAPVDVTPTLIPPHGGELQDRLLVEAEAEAELTRARELDALPVGGDEEAWLVGLASGVLSPLTGFMGEKDYLRVVRAERLERGSFWPVPVILRLPVGARVPTVGSSLALAGGDGRLLATLAVSEVWELTRGGERAVCLAGDVKVFAWPTWYEARQSARALRARLQAMGQRRVAALVTRGVPSRADEYIARAALELNDALLVMPWGVRGGPPLARCWDALSQGYFAEHRLVVAPPMVPYPPSSQASAALLAVIAQNLGAERLILPQAWLPPPSAGVTELQIQLDDHEPAGFSQRIGAYATSRSGPDLPGHPLLFDSAESALGRPEQFRPEVLDALR